MNVVFSLLFYMIKKFVPHLFTLANLFCGCLGLFFAFQHMFNAALFMVFLGVFFDFFDGFFARLLKVESALGVELDSLADVITSGAVPGAVLYQLIVLSGVQVEDYHFYFIPDFPLIFSVAPLATLGFLVSLGAAFRLARFNVEDTDLPYFKGLPAPANALFIAGLPLLILHPKLAVIRPFVLNPTTLVIIVFVSVLFMNIHWKMFSLKISSFSFKAFLFPLLLFLLTLVLLLFYGIASTSVCIIIYILLSSLKWVLKI